MIIEACVESLEEALLVRDLGAGRIELCADLALDGLTPDRRLIQEVIQAMPFPVKVMIRPHARSFVYSAEELETMLDDISYCLEAGAWGVVFGVLQEDGKLDLEAIARLAAAAGPMNVTIHKAIDLTPDPVEELRKLIKLEGVNSVLTSGGADTAEKGVPVLLRMLEEAGSSIEIVVAGKVTPRNLESLEQLLHAPAYHGRRIVNTGW